MKRHVLGKSEGGVVRARKRFGKHAIEAAPAASRIRKTVAQLGSATWRNLRGLEGITQRTVPLHVHIRRVADFKNIHRRDRYLAKVPVLPRRLSWMFM